MNKHHLDKIGGGKSITLTPDDLDNGSYVVNLTFSDI
jgi:hypothetical protein